MLKEYVRQCGLYFSDSRQELGATLFYSHESLGSIKGTEFIHYVGNYLVSRMTMAYGSS
jgi:hypothetical protein